MFVASSVTLKVCEPSALCTCAPRGMSAELVATYREKVTDPTELDAEDFDQPEKVVGSRRFDLMELIEDELILEVPFIPRHAQCPGVGGEPSVPQGDEPAAERESAFAALGALKSKHK